MKWGPTTANSQPMRVLYLKSIEAREKLRPALSAANLAKTMKAPMIAIVAYDTRFYEHLPRLYHKPEAIHWYNKPPVAEIHGFRNGSLQGAYLILALRAVGLDCGAMSGFENAKVDAAFFPDSTRSAASCSERGGFRGDSWEPRGEFITRCRFPWTAARR